MNVLAMQVALVLPFSMLLLIPVCDYRVALFFPALLLLVGAHYLPFAFLYGMRAFLVLAGATMAGAVGVVWLHVPGFGAAAWIGFALLACFGVWAHGAERRERRAAAAAA